jgi:hypothetical protein
VRKLYKPKKKFFTEKKIEFLIRLWFAGAVFFYIGWGTPLGRNSTFDFLFVLAIGLFVVEMILVNPIIRMVLNVPGTKRTFDDKLFKRVGKRLAHFLRASLITVLIYFTYSIINLTAITIFGLEKEAIVLPAEPIIFGLLYVLFHYLIKGIINNMVRVSKPNWFSFFF